MCLLARKLLEGNVHSTDVPVGDELDQDHAINNMTSIGEEAGCLWGSSLSLQRNADEYIC